MPTTISSDGAIRTKLPSLGRFTSVILWPHYQSDRSRVKQKVPRRQTSVGSNLSVKRPPVGSIRTATIGDVGCVPMAERGAKLLFQDATWTGLASHVHDLVSGSTPRAGSRPLRPGLHPRGL